MSRRLKPPAEANSSADPMPVEAPCLFERRATGRNWTQCHELPRDIHGRTFSCPATPSNQHPISPQNGSQLSQAKAPAYAKGRQALLAAEIEARRTLTRLAEKRKALPPGPVIESDWRFRNADGQELRLDDLFGPKNTLITYFWMYGPERDRPCPMCTDTLSGLDGVIRNI